MEEVEAAMTGRCEHVNEAQDQCLRAPHEGAVHMTWMNGEREFVTMPFVQGEDPLVVKALADEARAIIRREKRRESA